MIPSEQLSFNSTNQQQYLLDTTTTTTVSETKKTNYLDNLPMVASESELSGDPQLGNYAISAIDDEFNRIQNSNNNNKSTSHDKVLLEQRPTEDISIPNEVRKQNDKNEALVKSCKHQTRFLVALLGLTIAVVNCYAQATFCISIVEMVLPADYYVFKGDSGESLVKVVVAGQNGSSSSATTASVDHETIDNSCPVEYRYRNYYDSWRFPTTLSSNLSLQEQQQQQQPVSPSLATNSIIDVANRFDWDASRQGLLLGAFAVGTAPLQVLGGRLAEIYGAKWVLLAGCVGTALTNLTIPFLAHFSFTMLILNRIIMGIAQAGMEPGLMCLLADWLTPAETGFFISMLLFAICIGFFLGSLCSSFLLTLGYGWPITYYVAGGTNLLVAVLWFVYASSRPRESKLISSEELEYIEREQQLVKLGVQQENNDLNHTDSTKQNISTETKAPDNYLEDIHQHINQQTTTIKSTQTVNNAAAKGQAPWINILKTPSVWAFIICKISIRWCADVLSIELPTYLANVLHLSIKLNGILNSVSSALFAICSFMAGYLVNEVLKKKHQSQVGSDCSSSVELADNGISKTNLRKLMQSIASFGSAICVFLMTQYDCNILFSMGMLLILSCCLVMGTGGELQIPYDMTSTYPGTLHGMACTLSVSGWLAPPLIGLILGDQPSSRYRWSLVWYLTALINLIGGLVFVLFADASPRDFDRPDSNTNSNSNSSVKVNNSKDKEEQQLQGKMVDKTINEQEKRGDRGRHLTSYYNIACKSFDNSPPRKRNPRQQTGESGEKVGEGNKFKTKILQDEQANKKGDLSWSSYFDRDLIKIRQVEDSFIKPCYLNNFDSIARTQTVIFPYRTKPESNTYNNNLSNTNNNNNNSRRKKVVDLENNNEYATTNLVKDEEQMTKSTLMWCLWSRVWHKRRMKFNFHDGRVGMITKNSEKSLALPDVNKLPHDRKQGHQVNQRRAEHENTSDNADATNPEGDQQSVATSLVASTMMAPKSGKKTITHL